METLTKKCNKCKTTHEEKEYIPIKIDSVVSNLNILLFLEKINEYCEGFEYTTSTVTEQIQVFMIVEDFEVKHGDTWAEVRENIQRCHGLLTYRFLEHGEILREINLDTVVSKSNLAFINEKMIKHCGEDNECETVMETEIIRVWMKRREAYFEVKFGDTWAEVCENMHFC